MRMLTTTFLAVILAALGSLVKMTPSAAADSSAARHTYTKPDGETVTLPEGVEILPDGTELTNGVRTGHLGTPPPERVKLQRMQRFASQWMPFFHYVSDTSLLAPFSLDSLLKVTPGQLVTGLCGHPGNCGFGLTCSRGPPGPRST